MGSYFNSKLKADIDRLLGRTKPKPVREYRERAIRPPSLADLEEWTINDESLYNWCYQEENGYNREQVARFVRRNRAAVTQYVESQLCQKAS